MDEFAIVLADAGDPLLLIGFAWLAILGMLAWGLVLELCHLARGRPRVLFVHMLERCFNCGEQRACRHSLRWGWLGARGPECPNAALFAHAREARKTRETKAAT